MPIPKVTLGAIFDVNGFHKERWDRKYTMPYREVRRIHVSAVLVEGPLKY